MIRILSLRHISAEIMLLSMIFLKVLGMKILLKVRSSRFLIALKTLGVGKLMTE
jgi:hypothetical protein